MWHEDRVELAKRRKEAGLSQAELAKRTKRSRSLVRDVELGRIRLQGDLADDLWAAIAEEWLKRKQKLLKLKTDAQNCGWLGLRPMADLLRPSQLTAQSLEEMRKQLGFDPRHIERIIDLEAEVADLRTELAELHKKVEAAWEHSTRAITREGEKILEKNTEVVPEGE